MYFSGFADEAGTSLDIQIKATKELGWENIESRNIDGTNIHDLDEAIFNEVVEALDDAGVRINCFGSRVANWSQDVRDPNDVRMSKEQLLRAIPRMKTLGCSMIRGMSYTQVQGERPDTPEIRDLVVASVSELVKICEDEGILYLHENCMNFGGLSPNHTKYLLDKIPSPAFRLVFDTGNPVNSWDYRDYPPTKKQDSWEFFKEVKDFIHYVHIKDCVYLKETGGLFPESKHVWPTEGNGHVRDILKDLIMSGYDGGFSIEPHMGAVYHDPSVRTDAEAKYLMYVEYGKRLMTLVESLQEVSV